ncbi:UNVERIFIED_CONTAM: hypothetical protein RF648_20135, partial [Kocuria sp. CPCC 205274]
VQEQPEFKGEKKNPAFKSTFAFELIDVDTTGTEFENDQDKTGKPIDPRPACQFLDAYLFPGAGRGKVFELCEVLEPGIKEVPGNLEWFMARLGEIVNVRVGHYVDKRGQKRNKIVGVSAIPNMFKKQVGDARLETVAFNPYSDTPENLEAYSKLYKFQRDQIAEAIDKENIPFAGKEPIKNSDQERKPTTTNTGTTNPDESGEFADDVPF